MALMALMALPLREESFFEATLMNDRLGTLYLDSELHTIPANNNLAISGLFYLFILFILGPVMPVATRYRKMHKRIKHQTKASN